MKIQSVKIRNHATKKNALKGTPKFANTLEPMKAVDTAKIVPININRMMGK